MWAIYALAAALLQSATRITNQYLKLQGLKLTQAVKSFQILYILPVLFFITWPTSPAFYLAAILTAPLVVYQDKSLYDFTVRFGAGAVTRIEPLSVPLVFISWLLINPDLLGNISSNRFFSQPPGYA